MGVFMKQFQTINSYDGDIPTSQGFATNRCVNKRSNKMAQRGSVNLFFGYTGHHDFLINNYSHLLQNGKLHHMFENNQDAYIFLLDEEGFE